MHITLIAGARPNFMKVAPIIKAINELTNERVNELTSEGISYRLVHTGQHYDKNMSDTFFEELGIPAPDVNLGCGGGTQAEQTAAIMIAFEKELTAHPADIVMVVGDVTSTMACSIVAKKMNTKVCHVEAGIRSWDLTMPEEINRMVTDALADYMFTTSEVANRNLVRLGATLMENKNTQNTACAAINQNKEVIENTHSTSAMPEGPRGPERNHPQAPTSELAAPVDANTPNLLPDSNTLNAYENASDPSDLQKQPKTSLQRVWFVGNVMIDTLMANRARFRKPEIWDELGLKEKEFIVMTMHRPANVDEEAHLHQMMEQIVSNVHGLPVIFPIHPRTAKQLGLTNEGVNELTSERWANLHIVEPMGYLEFNYLVERAKAVVTDSGGITEETTVMGVPCITLRDNTERPETCTVGTNELIGTDPAAIKPALDKLFAGEWKKGAIPELWDGHAAERIISILSAL